MVKSNMTDYKVIGDALEKFKEKDGSMATMFWKMSDLIIALYNENEDLREQLNDRSKKKRKK